MTSRIAERLRHAADTLQAERVSMACLLRAHGPAAHGSLLLLLAVLSLLPIPGAGTVLGIGLIAFAAALWRGECEVPLPRRVAQLHMSCEQGRRVLGMLSSVYRMAERVARPRLESLVPGPAHRLLAASVGAMALVLVMPIPFGNVLPATAISLLALGIVFRDGLAVVLGYATSAVTAAGLVVLAVTAAGWVQGWVVGALT